MTKLEELTALLTNELNDFNRNIERLETIGKQLQDLRIKMDVTEYKTIIKEHQKVMVSQKQSLERFEARFNNKIDQAKIYPTWAVIPFVVCITALVGLVTYLIS